MSSKAAKRSDSVFNFNEADKIELRKRELRRSQIMDGALPESTELLQGLPLCRDDMQADVMAYVDDWTANRKSRNLEGDVAVAAELARAEASFENLANLSHALNAAGRGAEGFLGRVEIWLAYSGDRDSVAKVCWSTARPRNGWTDDFVTDVFRLHFAVGITSRRHVDRYKAGDADRVMHFGKEHLSKLTTHIDALNIEEGMLSMLAAGSTVDPVSGGSAPDEQNVLDTMDAKAATVLTELEGLLVVPTLPPGARRIKGTSGRPGRESPVSHCQ